jgi:hypothetical protein
LTSEERPLRISFGAPATAEAKQPVSRVEFLEPEIKEDNKFVVFSFTCVDVLKEQWTVNKRYSDFEELRKELLADPGDAKATKESEPARMERAIAVYKCCRQTAIRADFDQGSIRVGQLPAGAEIESLEERVTESGIQRIRFSSGWCSTETEDGVKILKEQVRAMVSRVNIGTAEHHKDSAGKDYVAYVVDCFGEGEPWRVAKRFSHFCELRELLLSRQVPGIDNIDFPSKVVLFGRLSDAVTEDRKGKLESWLNHLLDIAQGDFGLLKFLQNDSSWPMSDGVLAALVRDNTPNLTPI